MAYKLVILSQAEKHLDGLDTATAKRIAKKLIWIADQDEPLRHAAPLYNSKVGDARFRIGDYRAIAVVDEKKCIITIAAIGHRREIYR